MRCYAYTYLSLLYRSLFDGFEKRDKLKFTTESIHVCFSSTEEKYIRRHGKFNHMVFFSGIVIAPYGVLLISDVDL